MEIKKTVDLKKLYIFFVGVLLFISLFINNISAQNIIKPAASQDGVDFNVSIAKSTDGTRPADGAFTASDSIDLANVDRYNMFYAYFKIDYANNSGSDLTSTSITMQLPKLGETNYYEMFAQSGVPTGWVTYSNSPTGDGNSSFPAGNITVNSTSRLMTWTGTTISDGSTGTIYIKLPFRDPFTKFGVYDYNPSFKYTLNSTPSTMNESVQFDIAGQNDKPSITLEKIDNLGYVPSEPDANQYFYVRYRMLTDHSIGYQFPKRDFENDRFLTSVFVPVTFPSDSQFISYPANTVVSGNILKINGYSGNGGSVIVRYLKTDYPDPNQIISIPGIMNGRFIGDANPAQDVAGTEYTLNHPIGTGSTIPAADLGTINTTAPIAPISEDALKVGSVPFAGNSADLTRTNSTIGADELVYEFNGLEYIKDGNALSTDYGLNILYIYRPNWTGNLDALNPMSSTFTVYFDDGTSEVLGTWTEAEIIAARNAGLYLYGGNVSGKLGAYQPPAGKVAKKVVYSLKNAPQGFTLRAFVNGYLQGYPAGGADSVKFNRVTNLYGRDTGSGRPLATGSGDTSYTVPIAQNTQFQPRFTMVRNSAGTVNPGQTDTLKLESFFSNKATQSFVNPEFDVLLPTGYSFDSYTDQTNETYLTNLNVFNLPDGRLMDNAPVIEQIPNYNGTGRTLVRIKYTGILQESERMGGLLTIRAAEYMSPGNYTIDGYFAAENIGTVNNLSNAYTPYTVDVNDMNGNGQINDYIFGTISQTLNISRGVGTSLYSQVQGSYDPALTGQGTTKQNTVVDGALTLEYNGATPMNNIQLLSILPYEGDGKTLYGGVENGQRVTLAQAVDVSGYPGATVYYNDTATNDPSAAGWSTTYSANAKAVRVVLPASYELISGGVEKVSIPLKLQVPGTILAAELPNVQGIGNLPIKLYSNTSVAGLDGANSTIESLALGVNIQVFKDDNGNGIKEGTESWSNNTAVDIFNLSDNPATDTPLYSGTTNASGVISFLDSFNGVNLALQGYRVVVHTPNGNYNFVTGVGDVTTDANGQQGVVFNTSNQLVNVLSAYSSKTMDISGSYWQDYEASPNGIKDVHDLLSNVVGRTVRLFNVTDNVYESVSTTVQADGTYTLANVVVGPEYRVEFSYNSTTEIPSVQADNVVSKYANNILGYTFDSNGMAQDEVKAVNAAIIMNGTINVKFSVDGTSAIGTSSVITRGLPTTYTANIGTSEDTTNQTSGTFVVPSGYRLLASEPTSKDVTINDGTRSQDIIFMVELLDPNLSGTKVSNPSTTNLHPGDEITYTITVNNSGNEEALDTIIKDKVPANTELVSIANGGTIDANGVITWNIPSIAADTGSTSVSFTVKTLSVKNSGRWNVVNDQATFNGNAINSTSNEVSQGLLKFEKSSNIANLKELLPQDRIDYKIKVTNIGNASMSDIKITDTIPANTIYIDKSISDLGVIDQDNLTFTVDTLEAGKSIEVGFSVKINKDAKKGSKIENTAKVNGEATNTITHYVGAKEENNGSNKVPKTGDSSNAILFSSLLVLLGASLIIINKKRYIQ